MYVYIENTRRNGTTVIWTGLTLSSSSNSSSSRIATLSDSDRVTPSTCSNGHTLYQRGLYPLYCTDSARGPVQVIKN